MILLLNKKESAALALHMSIMRKSIRNILKKKYSTEREKWLSAYDYVMTETKNCLTNGSDQLNLNIRDIEILQEFIRAYQQKINQDKQLKKALSDQDKEQLQLLTDVQMRCQGLIMDVV